MLGFQRFSGGDIILGCVIFIVSILLQQLLQVIVIIELALYFGITGDLSEIIKKLLKHILNEGVFIIVSVSVLLGFIAAILQSAFKYAFVRNKSYVISMNVGSGFGLMEALYIGISGFVSQLLGGVSNTSMPFYYSVLSGVERFSTLLFHVGTTLYLYDAWVRGKGFSGFILIVILHGLIDSMAVLYQFTGNPTIMLITEISVLFAGLLLTLSLRRKTITEVREEIKW